MIRFNLVLCSLLVISSCKTVALKTENQKITTQKVTIGTVGVDKNFVLENSYYNTAIPDYNLPIKVSATPIEFTKKTFKAFTSAKDKQGANVNINYIDSLETKPVFISLNIIDRVKLIETLNNSSNKSVRDYLSIKPEANVVTSISIALKGEYLKKIAEADAVFMEQRGNKTQHLKLYNKDVVTQTINFTEGVVFAFNSSSCCWQENDRYKVNIVDVVNSKLDCPKNTYNSAKQAKKKLNYFKL